MPNTGPEGAAPASVAGHVAVHVAVGVIINAQHEVLIALRHQKQHQGGLWEFPGGKVEDSEDVLTALARELQEEVHLQVLSASPLIQIEHDYGDKRVMLDVWRVDEYAGEASGREGQPLRWVPVSELPSYAFPAANLAIVEKLENL